MSPRTAERILAEGLDRSAGPEGCWTWKHGRASFGYGKVFFQGKHWTTHRLAWITWRGPIPEGLCVCHSCDNPPCCNPAHLFLGTHADNIADRDRKGRGRVQPLPRGEANPVARLTEDAVMAIRRRYAAGESGVVLARVFGIHRQHVAVIVRGDAWGHLPLVGDGRMRDRNSYRRAVAA